MAEEKKKEDQESAKAVSEPKAKKPAAVKPQMPAPKKDGKRNWAQDHESHPKFDKFKGAK